jgi:NAD(P) transhydrogenase subunit alpha
MSLGGKFVELPVETTGAEDKGGYAKELGEEFYRKQRELMAKQVAESDVVITTAAIPGKKSPILITGEMLKHMPPGSVIIDLAAERGGNVDVTKPGEKINVHGVNVIGPLNIPSAVPYHSSQMYARNVMAFVQNFVIKGAVNLSVEDEINRETMVTKDGEVVNARVREALGMGALATTAA